LKYILLDFQQNMLKSFRKPKSILVHLVSLVPPIIKLILTNLQGSTESMNQWRSTTLAILRKEAPQKLKIETEAVAEAVINQVNSIMDSVGDVQHTETRDQPLRALVNSAIDLSRLLRVQKAIFSIIMPSVEGHQRTMFDPDTMEDIGGEDEDTLSEREIRCVTFPGILKLGDENGERTHLRNVVAKIRVLCAPD
jgi:activating signal cointegrator complex subunit 1